MGGDGGVVATNRRYLRGAGSADHTGDSKRASSSEIAQAEKERLQQMMKTCAIQGTSLHLRRTFNNPNNVVACPYGRLYNKEAAIEALLKRHNQKKSEPSTQSKSSSVEIGWHVRGLKDLFPVHFHYDDNNRNDNADSNATCPITGLELNGSTHSAFLIINSKKDTEQLPNVLSEKAIKEMGHRTLQEEYGPYDRLLRLAPSISNGEFDRICQEWEMKLQEDESKKKKKKKNKKRNNEKRIIIDEQELHTKKSKICRQNDSCNISMPSSNMSSNQNKFTTAARSNVAAAVHSNSVFSSLFQSKKGEISDKEKRDNLFAR